MTKVLPLLCAVFAVVPLAGAAAAAKPGGVDAAFGNTLVITGSNGRSRKIWMQPDGSWTGLSRRGSDLAGRWKLEGDRVCLSQSKPQMFGSFCQPLPLPVETGVRVKDPLGQTLDVKLVKGHVEK